MEQKLPDPFLELRGLQLRAQAGVWAKEKMMLFINILAVIATWIGAGTLADHWGCNEVLIGRMAFWGAVSFFLGPYATGSGFYVRGSLVDSATPESLWRVLGVIIWVAGAITMFMTRNTHTT